MNSLKIITRPILVAGVRREVGELIEVDDETAFDLLNLGCVVPADGATAARFRKTAARRGVWSEQSFERRDPFPRLHAIAR
jgi:hypothetical protein